MVSDTVISKPDFAVPPGTCDCHFHLFPPGDRHPFIEERGYTPPPVGFADLERLQRALSIQRGVIVQASVHGTDNGVLLDALARWPDRLRAVAVIHEGISDGELGAMAKAGVRGIRINLHRRGIADVPEASATLHRLGARVAPYGWHVQLIAAPSLAAALAESIARLQCPVVFDHFAHLRPSAGAGQPFFHTLLNLVRSGKAYVKLSGQHRVTDSGDREDVGFLAGALLDANPDRLLWGTDWPHVPSIKNRNRHGTDPLHDIDDGADLNRLARWIEDRDVLTKVLVDNPARLYGF